MVAAQRSAGRDTQCGCVGHMEMHRAVHGCTGLHRAPQGRTGRVAWGPTGLHSVAQPGLHRVAQGCTQPHSCTELHRDAPGPTRMHKNAPGCSGPHMDAHGCTGMHMRLPCSSNRLPALHRSSPRATVVGQPTCPAQARPVANQGALPRHACSVLLSAAGGCCRAGIIECSVLVCWIVCSMVSVHGVHAVQQGG
jgi:hypothetical protein